jgi:hypothetical protein
MTRPKTPLELGTAVRDRRIFGNMPDKPTRLLFPLRTSVELFSDPCSPSATVRAKHGAVLYDEIIFEPGAYDVTMTPTGSSDQWRPAEQLTDDELLACRQIHETGTSFSFAVGRQPAKGVPAPPSAMRTLIQGEITRHYVAEWESVMRALAPLKPAWARRLPLSKADIRAAGLEKEISRRDFACLAERLQLDQDGPIRDWTFKSFNRDTVIAEYLDATVNVTSQFLPVFEQAGVAVEPPGGQALEIFAPNLGEVPWEAVCEFREHAGCQEARAKLREFEQRALDAEPADGKAFVLRLSQEINRDFMLAFQDTKPQLGVEVARQALLTVVSVVPVVPPMANLMETALHKREHQRDWRTALMKLSPPPERV